MDGKKKKNRKKKGNNQSKNTDDVTAGVEEVVVPEQDNGSAPKQNHYPQVSGMTDVQSVGVSESDVELERHKIYEEKCVKLQEEVRQLEDEKNLWLQKEASLEEKIKLLQNDVGSCIKKEASLEEKLKDLQSGNDSSIQKEAILEDRVKHIEGIKESWILKETLINEMIARLNEVNIRLQEQVKELKESRDSLVQENTQLKESIAVMESRIQHIETEASSSRSSSVKITKQLPVEKDPQYQLEASPALAEKLDPERAELVEKVNEVYTEPDQHAIAADRSTTELDHVTIPVRAATPTDYTSEYGEEMFESGEKIQALARAHRTFGNYNGVEDFSSLNGVRRVQLLGMDDSRISEEIVSVPLDDIQVHEAEPQAVKNEETSGLPLSDAPLIGAPFRLISFVAKYVSGADLVDQERARSG